MTDDQWTRDVLQGAVADVEPTDALDSITARTAKQHRSRGWLWASGGLAVGVAATVTAFALVNAPEARRGDAPPAGQPRNSATAEPSPVQTSTPAPEERDLGALAVYFVGDTPQGPRLFREFERLRGTDGALAAVLSATQGTPADPDYRTLWPTDDGPLADGVRLEGTGDEGTIEVSLATASVHDRPAAMTEDEAQLSVEQVIYTAQAALKVRAPVQFVLDGNPIDQVLGVPTSEPLANAPQVDVLALVNITNPSEGEVVSGSLRIDGVANSNEANVPWEIRQGERVVKRGFVTADGWMDRLYPWQDTVDVSDLPPGEYTLVAMTDDPSNGEGAGPTEDSRHITIR